MNDVLLVRRFQRSDDLPRDRQRLLQRNRPARDSVSERRPIDQLQHQSLRAVALLEAVNGRDVRMIERGEELRLALEPQPAVGLECEQLGQDLQRDVAIQLRVARAVHLAHSADTQRADDMVGTDSMTRGEAGVSRSVVHRLRSGSQRFVEPVPTDVRQLIEEADVRGVRRQQRRRLHDAARHRLQSQQPERRRAQRPAVPRRPETAP